MAKHLLIAASLLINLANLKAGSTIKSGLTVFDLGTKDKVKMELGKQKLYGQRYKSALNLFKEILHENPTDGTALYYAAECYYKLNEYEKALELLKKGKESPNPKDENFFLLGRIYMSDGKIDEALVEFNTYKTKVAEKKDAEDVDTYISQCNNALAMKKNPINVKIENAGSNINSQYDDVTPCISADGRLLIFNSRRPETTDALMDVEGDGKYFQDIFQAHWDTINHKWNHAEEVPGHVNTDGAHDACTGMSADGHQIFIYKNDLNNPESRGGDIFVSKISGHKWKTPETMGKAINTSYWEGGACISPDGHTLFFTSERKNNGMGRSDIWMVEKINKTEWGKAVNLGPEINTEYDEVGLFLAPDGKTLFFCSDRSTSMGSYDIYRTIKENGKWSKPVNLGYPINTEFRDGPFVLSADAHHAYIASDRKGGLGESDIYMVDLQDYAVLEKDFKYVDNKGLSILKGMVRDGVEGKGMDGVEILILDEEGQKVAVTNTRENGQYFITLKGNHKYQLKIDKKGFSKIDEKIELPLGKDKKTFTLEKQFLLNPEK